MGLPKIEQGYYTHPNTGSHYTKNVVKNQNGTESEVKTMSSREIATLCEKEHGHVLRDIRNMLDSLDGSLLSHEYYQILTEKLDRWGSPKN